MSTNNYKPKQIQLTCPLDDLYNQINYKNVQLIKKFVSTRGRIMPRSKTGVCPKCQRRLATEIKRARYIGFMPFTQYV